MKAQAALLLTSALFAVSASAAPAKTVATLQQSGGFCRDACPTTTVTIQDNGQVHVEKKIIAQNKVEKYVLANLNQRVVVAIKKELSRVTPVALVMADPNAPMCMDIPEIKYSVVKDGQTIVIGEDKNCQEFRLDTFEGTGITRVLRDLLNVHNFTQIP